MKKRLILALLLMGFTSLVAQVLLIREFLVCFYGNELTIGLLLGNWIIMEAAGSSFFARLAERKKKPVSWYVLLQCGIALYLPIALFLTRNAKNILPIATGENPGLLSVFISSCFILAPLSILDGAQFPFGCRIWRDYTKKSNESVGSVYIFEAIGFIIAGPIFTYCFLTRLHAFHIVLVICALNGLSAFLLIYKEPLKNISKTLLKSLSLFIACCSIIALLSGFSNQLQKESLQQYWKNYTLIDSENSIYGNLAVTKEKEQYTFFSDGIPVMSMPVGDVVSNEEFIHFSMLSHPQPQDVLIIGGGAGGPLAEILKHPVRSLDYAELDPLLITMIEKYATPLSQRELNDTRLSLKITDGLNYIAITKKRYDIIFINVPIPTTLQLNRFYTKNFFSGVSKTLKKNNGLLAFKLPGSLNYLNDELKRLNASTLKTLKEIFAFVRVIPGDFNLYLASNNSIAASPSLYIKRLEERNITTNLLTPFHISYRLDDRWQEWLHTSLSELPPVNINTTLLPKGLFYALSYWNSIFSPRTNSLFLLIEKLRIKWLLISLVVLTALLAVISLRSPRMKRLPLSYAILTTGIFGMAFDLIIIFAYQSFYGYAYHHIALLITAFMAGLTLGGWLMTKKIITKTHKRKDLVYIEIGLVIFSLGIIPVLIYLERLTSNASFFLFLLSGLSGFLVGSEFPLANILFATKHTTQTGGILYGLDLFGSWIGALAVSVALIPIIGLIQTCYFLAALKCSSLILVCVSKSK